MAVERIESPHVILLDPTRQEAVLDEVRVLTAREPGFGHGGRVPMPDVTRCSRAGLA